MKTNVNTDARIRLSDLRKVYTNGTKQAALDGVTLEVPAGQLAAIMGPSGSGKSTLLNLIAGLDRPSGGRVMVDGVDVGALGEAALARYRREKLGFVFQFYHLLGQLSVLDNVLLPAQLAGVRAGVARARADELLSQLGIADKAQVYPAQLSGGERQRTAIVRALINRPAVLLADEPTGALDSRSGEAVMEALAQVHAAGQTVLLVTHDARLAATYAERVISLRDGRVLDDASMEPNGGRAPSDLLRLRQGEAS